MSYYNDECLPLRGQLSSLIQSVKIPLVAKLVSDSRLTTNLESIREHLTLRIIYNITMSINNSEFTTDSPEAIVARMEVLQRKLTQLNAQIANIASERHVMENKITDAQTRIQKILNKLPQSTDTRQLNLLDNANVNMENGANE